MKMSLSTIDARILGDAVRKARKEHCLTQAQCAKLLDYSLSYQKDLERCRYTPGLGTFYQLCRTLNISADECIFSADTLQGSSNYRELLRLLPQCDERSLAILIATATALIENKKNRSAFLEIGNE